MHKCRSGSQTVSGQGRGGPGGGLSESVLTILVTALLSSLPWNNHCTRPTPDGLQIFLQWPCAKTSERRSPCPAVQPE